MILLFARHGNTFEANEIPRIVGAYEDMPLTQAGEEQARMLGRALKESGLHLDAILAGPLQRTSRFAEIAAAEAGFQGGVRIDPRLRELDFGGWSGLSDDEVAARFGQSALDDWRKHGRRPQSADWAPAEANVRADLASLAAETAEQAAVLCVTSNGVLRYAMELDPAAFAAHAPNGGFRVKTGRICGFIRKQAGLEIAFWDEKPSAEILARLKG
ncbi:MAG: histidine phosphatase family protein [Caulobacterales bacterium]